MRVQLLAVGRLKAGPERELVERYRSRADAMARGAGIAAFTLVELPEGRERHPPERQATESAALLGRVGPSRFIAFDERGTSVPSERFAGEIGRWRDAGHSLALAIGGPDGLAESVRSRADLVLSFGALTLPHGLVRVLVVEQFYRALTILSGHPYHRGEPGRDG